MNYLGTENKGYISRAARQCNPMLSC